MLVDRVWTKAEQQRGVPQGQIHSIEGASDNDQLAMIVYGSYSARKTRLVIWSRAMQSSFDTENRRPAIFSERSLDQVSARAWLGQGMDGLSVSTATELTAS